MELIDQLEAVTNEKNLLTIDVNQLTDLKDKLKSNIDEKNKVKAEL